ncbi:MAG: hypothetical protein V4655_09350 [Bdellovibrionota bacterium]
MTKLLKIPTGVAKVDLSLDAQRSSTQSLSPDDLLATLRLILGYSEVLKHNLSSSFHLRASEDIDKITRVAWETLSAWDSAVETKPAPNPTTHFDAEHFMQALSHVAHVQMSRSCKSLSYFVPTGFGSIQGDEDCLLDICLGGLEFLQATARPERLSVHLFPSQVDGKDFINLDLRAMVPNLAGRFETSFASFFNARNPLRLQRACESLQAKFSLDVCQGRGLTFSVTFPDLNKRGVFGNLSRRDSPRAAIMLLGTDSKVERSIRDVAKETNLEILSVSQLRSGLRVFFEKQPGFVLIDAGEDGWGSSELIDSIRQQNKTCFIAVLVREGTAEYSDFPGSDLILEKPFKMDDLLRNMGATDGPSRRLEAV